MDGHLASLHTQVEMETLKAATQLSGVTNSVLIGGHEPDSAWVYTDGSNMDMTFMSTLRPGTIAKQTPTSPISFLIFVAFPGFRFGCRKLVFDSGQFGGMHFC